MLSWFWVRILAPQPSLRSVIDLLVIWSKPLPRHGRLYAALLHALVHRTGRCHCVLTLTGVGRHIGDAGESVAMGGHDRLVPL